MSKIKGQNFRLFVSGAVVPEATSCSITITGNTESSSTKDTVGSWEQNTVVSTSWSAQVDSYDAELDDITALANTFKAAQPVTVGWDQTSGALNGVAQEASFARTGSAILTDLSFQFNDRTNVTVTSQYQGTGALETV